MMRQTCWFIIASPYSNLDWVGTHTINLNRFMQHFCYLHHKKGTKYCLLTASIWIKAVWHCSLPKARISASPFTIFSSIPPSRQSPLLSHKWASLLYQRQTDPGGGTNLLSLSQQQLMQELQQKIGILKQAAVHSDCYPVPSCCFCYCQTFPL